MIGTRTVEYHQGQRSYAAPKAGHMTAADQSDQTVENPLAKRPSTYDGCGAPSRPSKQKTPLRHRLLLRRLADQKLAVGLHIVSLGVDLDLRRRDPLRIMLDFRGGVERVSAGA